MAEDEAVVSKRRGRFQWPGAIALRYRDYRLFWSGYITEVSGQQMLWIAQGWLIYELSGSALYLGAAGLARAIPSTVLSFVGGALADKLDQRRLLILVQAVQMALLTTIGTLTLAGIVEVWHLLLIVSCSAAAQSFENPARQAIFPRLIPRSALMDAVALNSTVHPGTRFLAPVLGGLLMTQVRVVSGEQFLGAATLFYLTALGYTVNAAFLYAIRPGEVEARRRQTSVMSDMKGGVRFVVDNPIFGSLILMTYCTQFFGWAFQSLFPVFAKDVFHGGELELGLMGSLLGAGSLAGAMVTSNLASVRRRGLLIIGGFSAPALLIIGFSFVQQFEIALLLLFLIGSTQGVFGVTAQSTLQYLVPNDFRGRVMGIWGMTHTAVQPLGQLQLGLLAGVFTAPIAVALGGLAMVVFALTFVLPNARIRRLTLEMGDTNPEEAAAQRAALSGAGRH